jgi:CelD/BcsL family acetyltransferase involved in cellulose biosynthesis
MSDQTTSVADEARTDARATGRAAAVLGSARGGDAVGWRRSSQADATTASNDGVTLRLLPGTRRREIAPVWLEVERRLGNTGLACSWEWTENWLDVYGSVVPHAFALAERDDGGGPCGLALVTRGRGRSGVVPIRRVHLGTAGEPQGEGVNVEYNRVLVADDARTPFANALIATLLRDPSWDELVLDGFAHEEARPLLAALPAFESRPRQSPYLEMRAVAETAGDVLGLLSSGTRRRIRRSLRGFGSVQTEWAETTEVALSILDELSHLHQLRWLAAGKPGAFASDRFRHFHRTLVQRLLPKGAVVLFRVRGPHGTLGCVYGFVERGRLLFYQSGLASFQDNKLRPGLVTHALCMQAAADHGLVAYDFLPGESRYKVELSNCSEDVVWATARRRHLKSRIIDGQRSLKRTARRLTG